MINLKSAKLIKCLVLLIIIITIASILIIHRNSDKNYNMTEKEIIEDPTASFNVNVNIVYNITVSDKLKNAKIGIIRAARKAMFDFDCNNAKYQHYNGYSVSYDVYIFNIIEINKSSWEVRFWEKPKGVGEYDKNGGYHSAYVKREKTGEYIGYISNPGGMEEHEGETY